MPQDGTLKPSVFGGWPFAGLTNPGGGTLNVQAPPGGPLTPGFWEPGMPYPDPLTFQYTSARGAAWMGGGTKDYVGGPHWPEYDPGFIYAPRYRPGGGAAGPNTYAYMDGNGGVDYDASTDTVHDWAYGASLITATSGAGARSASAHTYRFEHGTDPVLLRKIRKAVIDRAILMPNGLLYAEETISGDSPVSPYVFYWYRSVVYDMSAQPAAPLFDTGPQTSKATGWSIGPWDSVTRVGAAQYLIETDAGTQMWNLSGGAPQQVGAGYTLPFNVPVFGRWPDQGTMLTRESRVYDATLGAFVSSFAIRDSLTGSILVGPLTPSQMGFPDDAWELHAVSSSGAEAVIRAGRYHSASKYRPQTMVRMDTLTGTVTALGHYHFGDHPTLGYPYDHSTALSVKVLPDGGWVMLGEITPSWYYNASHYMLSSNSEHGALIPDRGQSSSNPHPSGNSPTVAINQYNAAGELSMVSYVPLGWMNGCVALGAPNVGSDFPTENASGTGAAHIGNVLISWWPTVGTGTPFTLAGNPGAPPPGMNGDNITGPTAWHTCDNDEPPPAGGTPGDGGVEPGWAHVSWMRSKDAGPGSGRTGRLKVVTTLP